MLFRSHAIDITLSLRAAVILKEEYPLTGTLIQKEKKSYRFRAIVHNLKPVTRFVIGFFGEVTIHGSPGFKKHVREQVRKMVGA